MLVKKALILLSFVGMIMFVACTDVTEIVGGGFVPDSSNMNMIFTDTVTIETYSIKRDSVLQQESSAYLLGSINDPIFGKTTAGINTKLLINTGFTTDFSNAEFFDSLVLCLSYTGLNYGDTLDEQTIRIYELEENFLDTADYYSNYSAQYNPIELASHTFLPKPNSKIPLNENDTIAPQIRIKITTSSTHPLVSKLLSIDASEYYQLDEDLGYEEILDQKFYEFFNGLHIATDPINAGSKGSLLGINLYSLDTRLELYKHDVNNDLTVEAKKAVLAVSTVGGKAFNTYDHSDYVDADNTFIDQVINGNKDLGQEQVYIQSLAGNRLRVKFPFIKNFKNNETKIAINKAELILSLAEDFDLVPFDAPLNLDAQIKYLSDSISVLPDLAFGENFVGGALDTIAYEYRFRVTNYVQDLIEGLIEEDDGLLIFSNYEKNAYNRVLLVGSNPMLPTPFSKRARLEITYTIIN